MVFKRSGSTNPAPRDPESLYRQLALTNAGPQALWLHQGDVLRAWHRDHFKSADVAIELPTGAGKTLVGGLIGEYQRQAADDRVAYLCPTRQLARQSAEKLSEYGIPNVLLTGRVSSWSMADRSRYTSASAIAVSVYSHVFNSNPALDDAELLLLDDAHAAEGYVAGPWSLEISRDDASAYYDVLSVLTDAIDPLVRARLYDDDNTLNTGTVFMASPLGIAASAGELEQVLSTAIASEKLGEDAIHAFKFLSGHIDQCQIYLSHRSLQIRPLIAPTSNHPAFDNPARRVYMSATLGAGGELERSFGRPTIDRIPIPPGWEKQGTGRRLFCLPQLSTDLDEAATANEWVKAVIAQHGRALVLTPDIRTAQSFAAARIPDGFQVLSAKDVEDDLKAFTTRPAAVLLLTNRYDGIDLPDDDCRLVLLVGLPARGDLQERFLHGSLGAVQVLQERIRARIMQGAGRATRNSRDYATVLILDDSLVSYVLRSDVQNAMHPEIHGEIEFGYQNSIDVTSAELLDQLRVFQAHDDEWRDVEQEIISARDHYERIDAPGAKELQSSVRHEVAASDAMWQGEWDRALEHVRRVVDELRGGRAPQRYAALWNYLAACIAQRLATQNGDATLHLTATKFYDDARAGGRGTTWLSYLAVPANTSIYESAEPTIDPLDAQALTGVLANAARLGKPSVFESDVAAARAALIGSESKPYERALVTLGELAGAGSSEGDGGDDAAPDATWIFGSAIWVSWEAKSDAQPDGELGAKYVRQAGGHLRYASSRRGEATPGESLGLLLTPQQRIHPSAHAVAEDHVYLVRPNQVLDLFDRLARAWRAARARDLSNISLDSLAGIFAAEGALPTQWLPRLRSQPLRPEADSG